MTGLVDVLRHPVVTESGERVGRVQDLIVATDAQHPVVKQVVVAPRRRGRARVAPWPAVISFDSDTVVIRGDVPLGTIDVGPDELLLNRDVLDTQVVDLNGLRVARVSDVILTDGPDDSLVVVAVDIGMGTILKRLGLWRSTTHSGAEVLDWNDLHLTSQRGHEVQLLASSSNVEGLSPLAIAHLLNSLRPDHAADIVDVVGHSRTSEAIALSHPRVAERLLKALRPADAKSVIEHLPSKRRSQLHRAIDEHPAFAGRRFRRLRGWRHNRPNAPQTSTDAS